jgi:RHS repeat-associated protein
LLFRLYPAAARPQRPALPPHEQRYRLLYVRPPKLYLPAPQQHWGPLDNHLFDAYGTEISPKSTGDPFAFGAQWGYYTDQANASDTGMVLCTWRYYDPLTGRFLTRDPIGYSGGLNLYAFAGNNPVSFADPSGTNPLICGAVGAGLGAIISGGVAYVHHQDVWRAVVHGAVVGGVTGFFACLGAPEVGAGFLGGFASGAVGGAVGNVYGQATAIAFGWQDCFNWPELLASAAFGGAVGGLTNVLGGAGGAVPEGSGCFVAGTPIVMADGSSKPIEQVKVGDRVLARDEVSGQTAAKGVKQVFAREVNETVVLTLPGGERIETTANHPFYVEGRGFLPAGELGIGALIVSRAGPTLKIAKIERRPLRTRVFNFEVEDFHSYFVGMVHGGAWVHNAPCQSVDPFDIRFSQDSIDPAFAHGSWKGRSLDEAVAAARQLGRLPEGLSIEVTEVNMDLVTLNNRTLYVAQQANLPGIPVTNVGPRGWNQAWKLMRDIGGPLPLGQQPRVR